MMPHVGSTPLMASPAPTTILSVGTKAMGALHALLLEAMLLPLAHRWGFWHSRPDIFIYAVFILLALALWHLVDYGISARTAAQINERIRENRLEKRKEMIP